MKKALAYVGSPIQLQDFIWYYLAYGKEYEWDLVCQTKVKEMKLEEICRASGLFQNIYVPAPFFTRPKGQLAKIGLEMFLYWLVGKSKAYARKEIDKITDLDQYEHMYLSTTRGVTCGLMALCADGIPIALMEEGNGDNADSHAKFDVRRIREEYYLVAYAFAKMGYFNIHERFPLKSMKKCVRFSCEPEKLSKELYQSVKLLNDMDLVERKEYDALRDKVFGIQEIPQGVDAVLFTTPLSDFTQDDRTFIKQTFDYLKQQNFHKILLKKHPRDIADYTCENMEIVAMSPIIPAENIVEKLKDTVLIFMYPSTTIKHIHDDTLDVTILKYANLDSNMRYRNSFELSVDELNIKNRVKILEI